ncbi:interferon-induced very large GTPase 1-like [Paramuricea clavata]|uniref:Interferon-induced very large GTPase 1-like n=1 Tax=Paramuricea clavata TaxID=317549 RepID=A0A7D9I5A4_PARCT|nr:interferon-induced very large GTPase 1-like [Paramuricea clavata]
MDHIWNSIKGLFHNVTSRLSDTENESSEGSMTNIDSELSDETVFQSPTSHENSEKCQESANFQNEETVPLLDQQSYSELDIVDPNKSTTESQRKEIEYCSLLNDLKLNLDVKFTLKKARIVDNNTINDKALTSANEIPKYIVEKLMIVDYHARAFKLNHVSMEQASATFDGSDDEDEAHEEIKETVNPMDAFLAIFHCADDFLRQDLAIKLSACQLSVPFLLPDPAQPSEKITMLLWALEGIKKSWKAASVNNEHIRAQHVFVLEHPFPIVSFIRVGTNAFSKSVLLNKIMSDVNGYHDFFFHKDCKGGGTERKIVDGLVELCWYLPGERKRQAFQKEICFANLRGDARSYRKQLSVLTKISSVVFLLLPSEYPQQSTKDILIETAKTEPKVFVVFKERPQEDAKQYFDDFKRGHPGKLSFLQKSTQANEDDFVEIIRQKIERNIVTSKCIPLKKVASFVNECGIDLDENSDMNSLWRESISAWIQMGPKDAKMKLKLQTQVAALANLERENYCPKPQANKSENERIDDIFKKQQEALKSQKDSFAKMDEQICRCLNRIAVMNDVQRQYALTILKHDLDKMSLKVLGSLQAQYRDAWLNIQKKKKQQRLNSSEQHSLSDEEMHLKQLEETVIESSFGLEHIIREIAQMYQLTEISLIDYAGAAADMLLAGQPLELMDGDSSYIPFKWFNAVFSKLVRKTNNAKLFVISVLGIQSSGKSTMLNTMFGLEFPVSAGRCTRGAFASLIPVSDSLKSASNFDYILIIDTEGLRGSGDPEVRQHDNELATFAIGVANLTIVNIFGENYNDMKEFLEIAVHAFLKMKLVREKRICQIVHQNVAAVEASDVLATERITLKKKLDEMAKLAAIQENCDDAFQELNDILSFDENDDVFYIPNLLQGSPPMAPVNPDYGRAVQKIKEKIISLMCSPERSYHPISQFQKRVCDLWKAILRENFIFSFRNTIEVRAYTSLDQKYFEESVKTMVTGMTELEKKIHVSLMRSSADAREDIWSVSKMEIQEKAEELGSKMEKAMEDFFETNEDKTTLEQWKENIMNKIRYLQDYQMMEIMRNCQAAFHYWQSRQEVDIKKQTYENELLAKARTFISSVEDTDDVERCTAKFEQEWQQWIEYVPPCMEKPLNINQEMTNVLFHTDKRLTGEMKVKYNAQGRNLLNFKDSLPSIKNQLNVGGFERFLQIFRNNPQLVMDAERIQDNAIRAAIDFAKTTSRSGVRCRPDDLKRMYHLVISTINKKTKNQKFKFPTGLLCDTLLCAFANAYNDFYEMEERYIRERDIRGDLERTLRPKLEKYFLSICKEMQKEVRAATLMVDVLQKAMEDKLIQSIGYYCLANADNSVNLLLQNEVKKIEDRVLEAISIASRSSNAATFSLWREDFVDNCSTLEITAEMFNVAAIDDDLKDFEMFESQLIKMVKEFLQSLVERGVSRKVYTTWNPAPHQKLLDLMFGCQECCPFCKGLCDQTVRDHAGGHSTRIHRPQGITGYRGVNTQILVNCICTTSVSSDGKFKNVDTSDQWHPYKEYQTVNEYYKSWAIPPDPSFEASTYWKWFMATFSQELADYYGAKPPKIPLAWKNISFEEARKQLREEFNLA